MMNIVHLGVKVQEKVSNHINKEFYLSAEPEGMPGWKEEHYQAHLPKASLNYDLNMRYFKSLDKNEFAEYIVKQCKKHKFIECKDLNTISYVEGIYMMVLDNYNQVYIGQSTDIKKRIQGHWRKRQSLERLVFGDICNSVLSIDAFGALDTTRVFYIETSNIYSLEEKIVRSFNPVYTLNRTAGGIGSTDTYTDSSASTNMAIVANRRKKDFIPFVTIEELRSAVSENELKYYLRKYPNLAQ